ncbi:unnamed protein product, partial [marine sediment metagenome]
DHYMLTDSCFNVESTILKQRLSDNNISGKFKERKGQKSVIDYRGYKVLSSFEVFNFLESEWLIIAKIDENEVVTNYFKENRKQLDPVFQQSLKNQNALCYDFEPIEEDVIEVDMDEFQRIDTSMVLYTHGVSTCTVILITFPGKFSYLAHISSYDRIYNGMRTDLLGQMLKQISFNEIFQSEKQKLEFAVIAPHVNTIDNVVDILINEGYFLSQVKYIDNQDAIYGNISYNFDSNKAIINWKIDRKNSLFITQKISEIKSIGEKIKNGLGKN